MSHSEVLKKFYYCGEEIKLYFSGWYVVNYHKFDTLAGAKRYIKEFLCPTLTPRFNAGNYRFDEVADLSFRQINAAFRASDTSELWPVKGRFNVTERAIRRLRKARRGGFCLNPGLEYSLALEREISQIVNSI